jgi:hypothetical protein
VDVVWCTAGESPTVKLAFHVHTAAKVSPYNPPYPTKRLFP